MMIMMVMMVLVMMAMMVMMRMMMVMLMALVMMMARSHADASLFHESSHSSLPQSRATTFKTGMSRL